jgi:biotin transport system permease protein
MLALYIHDDSVLHRLPAGAKILIVMAVSAALVLVSSPVILLGLTAGIGGLYVVARLPLAAIAAALKPVLVIAGVIFALQFMLAGWSEAAASLLRILTLVLLASLVTLTTRLSDMLDTLTRAARPLAAFGLSPPKLALAISLTIRFIPAILQDWQEIQRARIARGARRVSFFGAGPVIIKVLRMTDALGDAIAARGFEKRK